MIMDVLTKEQRHRNMSSIRSKNTKPEIYIRQLLFSKGYRYRLHNPNIPGKPDLWLKKYNTAIFINGCYWHRHKNCKFASQPKSNSEFWNKKFDANIRRDHQVRKTLNELNIRYLDIWECTIKRMKKDGDYKITIIKKIEKFLKSDTPSLEL